ncbi:MAG: HipA domain-containing protein, partial [Crocinitomicaceae bacterium]
EEMFRRMVFNVIATNYNDHTKNFAFLLKQGQSWELAPTYDVCYAYDPTNSWVNQQTLSVNGKHSQITENDLMTIAKTNNIKKAASIIKEMTEVVSNWKTYANQANVANELAELISKNQLKN